MPWAVGEQSLYLRHPPAKRRFITRQGEAVKPASLDTIRLQFQASALLETNLVAVSVIRECRVCTGRRFHDYRPCMFAKAANLRNIAANHRGKVRDMLGLIAHGGPALCNIAVTNSCNATCEFCNFANGKVARKDLRWMNAVQLERALDILHGRGIRYVSFFGGEPLLHPELAEMISMAAGRGMGTAIITNGWLLPLKLDELAASGLKTVYISIDSPLVDAHESNRGLQGLIERIRSATARMPGLGITALAQVTMSKLIEDYDQLASFLRELGFQAVAFSYPQRKRLGSSSLAWSADSALVNFTDQELAEAFNQVDELRKNFRVNNPHASIADMQRHLRGKPERFVCYGGYKSFYMDWNFDMWRCDAWQQPMCKVWDFAETPLLRDGCTACIADCYRDSSVMLHFAVSLGDAFESFRKGRILQALKHVLDSRNLESLAAVAANAATLSRIAKLG